MKNAKTFLLLFLFIVETNFAQWIEQQSGVTVRFDDVCFVDSLHGWAKYSGGTVVATTDGGNKWEVQLQNAQFMTRIEFYNQKLGFISMASGIIAKTEDGGKSWKYISTGFPHRLTDIYFVNTDSIWVTGRSEVGIILLSSDGGENWIKKFEIPSTDSTMDNFTAITFFDKKNGWVLAEDFCFDYCVPATIYGTTDGGENWEFFSDTIVDFYGRDSTEINVSFDLFVQPDGILWAWGIDGLIKSTDFGRNWILPDQTPRMTVSDFCFVNSNLIFFAQGLGGNGIYYSEDSGVSWTKCNTSTMPILRALSSGGNKIWAVGNNGRIFYKTDIFSDVEDVEREGLSFNLSQNYPNPFNPSTIIKYSIPYVETQHAASKSVRLNVFDILGREIQTFVNAPMSAGEHEVTFNGSVLPSGVYFYRIQTENFTDTKKMVLIK